MNYSPRFRLFPTTEQRGAMDWQRNTVRQLYNHALSEFEQIPEDTGTLRQRVWMVRDTLPALKDWWPGLKQVYSTVLQKAVERIRDNIQNLGKLKAKGYDVGSLNWKRPRDFRSFTYRQSGFELDKKSGPNGRGVLILKKLKSKTREIPIRLHRDLPDHESIKEVTLKKDSTGAWDASFCIETETPGELPRPTSLGLTTSLVEGGASPFDDATCRHHTGIRSGRSLRGSFENRRFS